MVRKKEGNESKRERKKNGMWRMWWTKKIVVDVEVMRR